MTLLLLLSALSQDVRRWEALIVEDPRQVIERRTSDLLFHGRRRRQDREGGGRVDINSERDLTARESK